MMQETQAAVTLAESTPLREVPAALPRRTPALAHFVWIGPDIPWAYAFAVLTAARNGALDQVCVHYTTPLSKSAPIGALAAAHNVELCPVDARGWMEEVGAQLRLGSQLVEVYDRVQSPVARSNMLRAAALYLQGGIYLDMDTLTLRSLHPLLDRPQMVGVERVVWPRHVHRSRAPHVLGRALALEALRAVLRLKPHGYGEFAHVEHLYHLAVNGAVLGSEPRGTLMERYLEAMVRVPVERQTGKHALGTHLLQQTVAEYRRDDLTKEAPAVFYPMAPEISEHWFREYKEGVIPERALSPETRVVHWYASVRTKRIVPRIDPEYVRAHRHTQLYSALAHRALGDTLA